MSKIENGGLDQFAKCKAFNGIGGEKVNEFVVEFVKLYHKHL